jgi:hypothetical protein
MAILKEATRWRAPKASRGPDLTADEQVRVKVALAFLAKRHGTFATLAKAMGLKRATVLYAASKRGSVTAGVALRAARAAKVPLEDILSGTFPKAGSCPMCGRC